MGDLIEIRDLQQARRRRLAASRATAACRFHFDLASPFSYLAAERVEAVFDAVEWVPARSPGLAATTQLGPRALSEMETRAERRAAALRLGLVWPEQWARPVPRAMRAAAYAVEAGRGAAFVLAAGRLAFCGGFCVENRDILSEAAAAAGLDTDAVLAAALNSGRDAEIERAGRRLISAGADCLPVVEVGGRHFCGEDRLEAAAAVPRASITMPAPVGSSTRLGSTD